MTSTLLNPAGRPPAAAKPDSVAFVYLLECSDRSLYCGWTTDVERRLAAHAAGTASRYTRSRRPVELVAAIPVADRSAALREEARIKRLPRAAKLELVSRSRPPSSPARHG
jgi:putative endonuclease